MLVGAGDIANSGSGDEATAKLLDVIPGTVFTAGDNAYDSGTDAQFANYYDPTWGRHKARTKPSAGNHDYNTSNAQGYRNYFGYPSGPLYYAYDLGSWRVYSLDSNISMSVGSAQETWLRADLAANPRSCIAAYWHHPRYSSGGTHGSNTSVRPLYQALYDYGADVVVNGHEHNYERFAKQDASGNAAANGIREFVAGMGGASHYGFGSVLPNSEARNSTVFGVLKLTLHSSSYDWQFVPVAGQTYADSGSQGCN